MYPDQTAHFIKGGKKHYKNKYGNSQGVSLHRTFMVHVSFKVKDKYLGKHRQRPANIVICRRQLPFVPANELGNDRILSLSVTHDVCWYLPICPSLPSWLLDLKYPPCQHHPLYHARFALMNVVKCHLKYASMRFVRAVVFR